VLDFLKIRGGWSEVEAMPTPISLQPYTTLRLLRRETPSSLPQKKRTIRSSNRNYRSTETGRRIQRAEKQDSSGCALYNTNSVDQNPESKYNRIERIYLPVLNAGGRSTTRELKSS
jgi:hypothetical protein